jgi:hypothetical protein
MQKSLFLWSLLVCSLFPVRMSLLCSCRCFLQSASSGYFYGFPWVVWWEETEKRQRLGDTKVWKEARQFVVWSVGGSDVAGAGFVRRKTEEREFVKREDVGEADIEAADVREASRTNGWYKMEDVQRE